MRYLILYNFDKGIKETDQVPRYLKPLRISYMAPTVVKGPFGIIFSQKYSFDGVTVEEAHFRIRQPLWIWPTPETDGIFLQFMLKGSIVGRLEEKGAEFALHENEYNLFHLTAQSHKAWLEPGNYHSAFIRIDPIFLSAHEHSIPGLRVLKEKLKFGTSNYLTPGKISKRLLTALARIREAPLENVKLRHRWIMKGLYSMIGICARALEYPTTARAMTPEERQAFRTRMMEYLEKAILQSGRVKMSQIAKHHGMTTARVKGIFRDEFHSDLQRYILERRLFLAYHAVGSTESRLTDIADNLGFSDHPHLTRCFKERFGITPSGFRLTLKGGEVKGGDSDANTNDKQDNNDDGEDTGDAYGLNDE